jgi:hypothetical protein
MFGKKSADGSVSSDKNSTKQQESSRRAFWLVVIMLITLFLLVSWLLWIPGVSDTMDDKKLEYFKTALSVLLGAFGAWIGAGAAHFFGRENLNESSRSTEAVLQIQGEALRSRQVSQVRDLNLVAMNNEFIFRPGNTKKDVTTKLAGLVGYWFVPMVDTSGKGILEDVIHERVIWDSAFNETDSLASIISNIETKPQFNHLKNLHGPSFFATASLDDKVAKVSDDMKQNKTPVGIVVDDKGKPIFCFTRTDMQNALELQKS